MSAREIEFLSLHPATPNRDIGSRDREFENAVKHFSNRRGNIVVLGDLNATPYCPALKKLCRTLGLKNAREGHGIAGTFPVFFPFWWLRLPIDHVLVGRICMPTVSGWAPMWAAIICRQSPRSPT